MSYVTSWSTLDGINVFRYNNNFMGKLLFGSIFHGNVKIYQSNIIKDQEIKFKYKQKKVYTLITYLVNTIKIDGPCYSYGFYKEGIILHISTNKCFEKIILLSNYNVIISFKKTWGMGI